MLLGILGNVLRKVKQITVSVLNFTLISVVYAFGAGLSYLLWKVAFARKRDNPSSYWMNSEKLSNEYSDYLKQF